MSSPQTSTQPTAILFALFSLLISLLIFPPMLWHLRNRNIGATSLIAWILALNLFTFVNALIWRTDDTSTWFNGTVLCDVEVKIQVASAVGFVSSTACVLKALARVMDTDRTSLGVTRAQRRRGYAVDLMWCLGFPALQMLFHYIVQPSRYYIWGFSGCTISQGTNLLGDLLVLAPPMVWTVVCVHYALLIILRLHRYRQNFTSILASHSTSKSRFFRLFMLCILWVLASIPIQAYIISIQAAVPHKPYSWSATHDAKEWSKVVMVPSGGRALQDRYIWLCMGVLVFVFFGLGRDAVKMYKQGLRLTGLGTCFPGLWEDSIGSRKSSATGTISSVSSKAKLYFARKSGAASSGTKSWAYDSRSSKLTSPTSSTTTDTDPTSPKTATFLATVHEHPNHTPPQSAARTARISSFAWKRMTSPLRSSRAASIDEEIALGGFANKTNTVVSAPPKRPSAAAMEKGGQKEIMVKREVRQGSEKDERAGCDPRV